MNSVKRPRLCSGRTFISLKSTPLWRITGVHWLRKTAIWVGSRFDNRPLLFHYTNDVFLIHTNYCQINNLFQNQNQLYKACIQELLKRRVQRNFFRGKQLFNRPRFAEPSSTPRSHSTPHYQVNTLPCPWIVLIRGGNCRPLKEIIPDEE